MSTEILLSSTGCYVVMAWLLAVMICSKRSTLG